MATIKISELPASAPLTGDELLEASQLSGGAYGSVQTTAQDVAYAGAKYGSFYDTTDQTGNVAAATAVKFGTSSISTHGVTVVTNGSTLTRVTYEEAGTYMIAPSLQLKNTDTTDRNAIFWVRKQGVDIPYSSTEVNVPKAADGGVAYFQLVFYVTVTAGQYIEIMWLPANANVTIDYTAAGAIAPAIPSAILVTERIGL